jgi:hypothetical protein
MKKNQRIPRTGNHPRQLALTMILGLAAFTGTTSRARADLVGHWISGAPDLIETSGYRSAGTHDGVAVGNTGALAFSSDVPDRCTGQSLDLTAGGVGVMVGKSATSDSGYVNTYDEGIRSQFTIAFWAKGFPGTWSPWVCKRGEDSIGWQIRRMGNDPIAGFTLRGVDNEDGWGSSINVNDSPAIWHHFAGVWNQATGTRKLYVDGVFSHTVNNNTAQAMAQATGKHLTIGAREEGGSGYGNYFSGKLFDVRIYNMPLTQNQVLELLPPTVPSGLAAVPGNAKVGLLWTPKPGATGYTVWTKNTVTAEEQTDTTTDAVFSKTGLDNGTLYLFKVMATNTMGSSDYSTEVSATPVLGSAKDILTFNFSGIGPATISGTTIIKDVPLGTDVTSLTPIYTISPFATEDAANPSGAARNFTSPRTYTITAEDGSTKSYTVTVNVRTPITYNFDNGLQGWTQIWPIPSAGRLWNNNQLGAGHDRDDIYTRFGRSPEFYLNNLGDLTFMLDGGQSPLAAPGVPPSEIPEAAIDGGGFAGLALRDVATDTYLMSKRHAGNGNWQTASFTAAELAPYANDGRKYTVDYIDYNYGGWGWTYMDNVSIPGTSAPAADITVFGLAGVPCVLGTNITLRVPYGVDVAALAPTFTLSPGATCDKVSGSTQNFSTPVTYTVTSSDLLVTKVYTVTATTLPDPATALIGHWAAGAETLADTSGFTTAGTHDGVAAGGNAAALAFSSDEAPLSFGGSALDLRAGNVGVLVSNSSTADGGYVNTFDAGIANQCTISFWAKGYVDTWVPWVSKKGEDGAGWQVRRHANDSFPCFTVRGLNNDDGGSSGTGANIMATNPTWHHYTGVWDQATGTRTVYVDGVVSSLDYNVIGQTMSMAADRHLMLGARQKNADTNYDGYFAGLLYDVRIYNQVLFSDQVQAVMTTPTSAQAPEAKIRSFGLPGRPAVIVRPDITWTLPVATNLAALAPTFTLTAGATCVPVSGTTRDFNTPQTYTVTSSDSLITTIYTVTVVTTDNFNDGTLQGWHNRVWDATAGAWVDLDPDVIAMPSTINGGVIQPPSSENYLYKNTDGIVQPNGGQNDGHLNTVWLRSPEFYLKGSADLTVQMAKGMALGPAPADDMSVPYAAITDGGWKGVALRRVSDGVFVLAKPRTSTGDAMITVTFTAAELAPYVGVACTLDLINSGRGGWGWLTMDNAIIPRGVALSDPFVAWIDTNYPTLADKSPTGDPDGDGMTNQQEFAFGLNPASGSSVNPITVPLNPATGTFQYTRLNPAVSGLTYTVLTSANLQDWAPDAGAGESITTNGDIQTITFTITASPVGGKLFVRVEAK